MSVFQWEITATRFLKTNRKWLINTFEFTINNKEPQSDFVTTSIKPTVQGTMFDTLFSWICNKEILVDKYEILKDYLLIWQKYEKVSKKLFWFTKKQSFKKINFENDKKLEEIFKLAHLSAILTMGFRSGMTIESIYDFLKLYKKKRSIYSEDLESFKTILKRLKNRSDKIVGANDFIDNPLFGQELNSGKIMRADGDYFYNNTLGEMKSSKDPKIKKDYILQMLIYFWLNSNKKDKLKIEKLEVFNPLWNLIFTIKIKDVKFNKKMLSMLEIL